jgi:hypothetical protein
LVLHLAPSHLPSKWCNLVTNHPKKKVDGYPSLVLCPCQQTHMNSWCSSLHFCHHCMRCFLKLYSTPFIDELTSCSWKMTFAL